MARKVVQQVTIIDDLDGTEIGEDQAVEVLFGHNNINYRMDLSKANASKFEKLITPYVEAAARVSGGRGRPRSTGSKRADSGSGRSKEELANIRDWLKKNGHDVSPRGRIKADLLEAYDKAHEPQQTFSNAE